MNLNRSKKSVLVTICIVLASLIAVGSTVAFIMVKTGALTNIFSPGEVSVQYRDGTLTNIGDADVYVRMTYAVTLVRSDNKDIYYGKQQFDESSYTVVKPNTANLPSGWTQGSDGIYYYTGVIAKGASLSDLPTITVTANDGYNIPEGYVLAVQYLFSAIQANPTSAVQEAWGGSVTDGTYAPN